MVSARGATLKRLQLAVIVGPKRRVFWPVCWRHIDDTLTDSDYASAASTLDCAAAAIQAVADTEARGDPWDRSGRPLILFERHKFARHTRGVYNRSHPDISAPRWGGYGPSHKQYDRLKRAAMLDEPASLKSASWGLFQIMGENHGAAGFRSVEAFVDAMLIRRSDHLLSFVNFVKNNSSMKRAIQKNDWSAFARLYNGPSYAKNDYDGKIRRAYERILLQTKHPNRGATRVGA